MRVILYPRQIYPTFALRPWTGFDKLQSDYSLYFTQQPVWRGTEGVAHVGYEHRIGTSGRIDDLGLLPNAHRKVVVLMDSPSS